MLHGVLDSRAVRREKTSSSQSSVSTGRHSSATDAEVARLRQELTQRDAYYADYIASQQNFYAQHYANYMAQQQNLYTQQLQVIKT